MAKSKHFSGRLTEYDELRLKRQCELTGKSRSTIASIALAEYLDRAEGKNSEIVAKFNELEGKIDMVLAKPKAKPWWKRL